METIRKHLKWISFLLAIIFLFQSCKVYHNKTATVDEAVRSFKRVKINSYGNHVYKFENLQIQEGQLFGLAKRSSKTAETLSVQIVEVKENNKYVKIHILDNTIKEIHIQNKTMSIIVPIGVTILAITALSLIFQDSFLWKDTTIPADTFYW